MPCVNAPLRLRLSFVPLFLFFLSFVLFIPRVIPCLLLAPLPLVKRKEEQEERERLKKVGGRDGVARERRHERKKYRPCRGSKVAESGVEIQNGALFTNGHALNALPGHRFHDS